MKKGENQNEALIRILHSVIYQKEWLKYKRLSKHSRRFKATYMILSKCTWNFEPLKLIRVVGIKVVLWWENCSTRVRNPGVKPPHPEHCSCSLLRLKSQWKVRSPLYSWKKSLAYSTQPHTMPPSRLDTNNNTRNKQQTESYHVMERNRPTSNCYHLISYRIQLSLLQYNYLCIYVALKKTFEDK
jgi:hypothetical protein